jgi:hypothetical protein
MRCTNNALVLNGCIGGKIKSATTASIRILQDKIKGKLFVYLSEHKVSITYGKLEVFLCVGIQNMK